MTASGLHATNAPGSRAYVWFQSAGWALYALVGIAITGSFSPMTPAVALTTCAGAAFGALGTHLLRRRTIAGRWFGMRTGPLLLRLALAVLVTGLAIEAGVWAFGTFITRIYTVTSTTPAILFVTTLNWIVIVLLWVALYAGIRFFRHYREAQIRRLRVEVAAREAQLASLNAQIHPHFLFNALNTLRALIPEDPARARDLVTQMAELLRYALQAGRREKVTLGEELEIVRAYLHLEAARYEDRLRWRVDAPAAVLDAELPAMALQTLVENAVRHGIAARTTGGEVTVQAESVDGDVRVTVRNPGRFTGPRTGGVGLPNARERLRLLFGTRASLDVGQDGEDVRAVLRLPVVHRAAEANS